MARNRKQRRQQHGSAWHWKQTDCWYYTEPGAKKRVPLFDEQGERIRGKENKDAARTALARIKAADELFIKNCILTGARPYSELAKVTAAHVVETPQGMYYLLKARTADGQHGHLGELVQRPALGSAGEEETKAGGGLSDDGAAVRS